MVNNPKIVKLKIEYNDHIAKYSWQKALVVLQKMIDLEPQAKFYCKQGGIYFKLHQHNKSISSFKNALALEPENQVAQECLKKLVLQNDLDISGVRSPRVESLLEVEATVETLIDISGPQTVFAENATEFSVEPTQIILREESKTSLSVATVLESKNPASIQQDESSFSQKIKQDANQFGRYHILSKIGSGGMGHVYKVRDLELDRILALKIVNMELDTIEGRDRFIREARATAKLSHPNIVVVHDIGEQDGRNFFTMDYIEGISLKHFFQLPETTTKDILRMFLQISSGLQYAHEQEIIHRDIKPSNIMVIGKKPVIMDFGLAKVTSGDKLSRTGQQMGTPAYMPPEQADGKEIDFRADVYSLGATLYEGLTGRPPFQGENHFNVIYQLHYKDPVSIHMLNPDISPELEAICLKCLEKSPESRYVSVAEFSQDIENFLKNRPIKAKPATHFTKIRKWIKRNKAISLSTATILITLTLGAIFCLYQWRKTMESEHKAVTKSIKILLARAKKNILHNEWREAGILGGEALQLILPFGEELNNDKKEAQDIIRASLYGMGLKWEMSVGKEQRIAGEMKFAGKWSKKYSDFIDFHPDGKIIAIAGNDGTIKIHDAYDGSFLYNLANESKEKITAIAFHPDGTKIISGNDTGKIEIWDIWKKQHISTMYQHGGGVSALTFSSNGIILASASYDKTIRIYNMQTFQETILEHQSFVSSIDFGSNDENIACASGTRVIVWNLTSTERIFEHDMVYAPNTSVAYSSSGKYLAVSSWENKIQVFNPQTQEKLTELFGHTAGITFLSFQENQNLLLSSSENGTIILWDSEAFFPIRHFSADTEYVECSIFHPQHSAIASYSKNNIARLWSISGKEVIADLDAHTNQVIDIAFSHDGKILASADRGGDIILWDYETYRVIGHCSGHMDKVLSLAFSPDDRFLVSSGYEHTIRVWDVKTRKEIAQFIGHEGNVFSVEFSKDGNNILSASADKTVKVWNVENQKCIHTIQDYFPYFCATYSNDGKKIAVVSQSIQIYSVANLNKPIHVLESHKNWFAKVTFSPDDTILASSSGDNTVRIWDWSTQKKPVYVFQHDTWVWRLAFHPNGKMLACACADGNIRIIDIKNGIQLYQLSLLHKQNIFTLKFHPGGEFLATGSTDNKIKIWDFSDEKSHINIPGWFEHIPKKYRSLAMELNFRRDASGAIIQNMLETFPRDICKKLFTLEVKEENFSIAEHSVDKMYEYLHICSRNSVAQYLQQGEDYYQQGLTTMALDYLQLAMKLDDTQTIAYVKKHIPEIKLELAKNYAKEAQQLGNMDEALKRYDSIISLYPLPTFYTEKAQLHQSMGNNEKYQMEMEEAHRIQSQINSENKERNYGN